MSALPLLTALALARACAPTVAPETLLSVATTESGLDPLAIGVNGRPEARLHPTSRTEAVQRARALLAAGRNLDLGIAQINVRNLQALRMTLEQAFDPCLSLQGGAAVLTRAYVRERRRSDDPQAALAAALSIYNTGDPARGLRNGYVGRVHRSYATIAPAVAWGSAPKPASPDLDAPVRLRGVADCAPPALDVFAGRSPPP